MINIQKSLVTLFQYVIITKKVGGLQFLQFLFLARH